MAERHFGELLRAKWAEGKFVCVGLDSEYEKIPANERFYDNLRDTKESRENAKVLSIIHFNRKIIRATSDLVCAYKINTAFYEALGDEGFRALYRAIVDINEIAPDVPVILDAKRGDIGNTNMGYVEMAFGFIGVKADAITVHPYLGKESLAPFLERKDKGIFVLCRTSNPGAGEFQSKGVVMDQYDGRIVPFYQYVANRVAREWNINGNCGVVVGATYPEELREVRRVIGDMPILIPGIGAQGGDLEKTVMAGKDSRGEGMIINSSRGIIFASNGPDFADAARGETEKLHALINQYRKRAA